MISQWIMHQSKNIFFRICSLQFFSREAYLKILIFLANFLYCVDNLKSYFSSIFHVLCHRKKPGPKSGIFRHLLLEQNVFNIFKKLHMYLMESK